jgi:hypothetical protein
VSVPVVDPGPSDPNLETQVFWVRVPGDDRTIDLPGYRDPASGPPPLVLYGSVTNVGTAPIINPFVTATWLDGTGAPRASFTTSLLAPGGTEPIAVLEGGALADVVVVITDPAQIASLADLAPELRVGAQ